MEKVKIVVVEPNKKPYEKLINNTMTEIYGLVYYPYKEIQIQKEIYVIYSKEATEKRDKSFTKNRKINALDIYGTFVIVSKKDNEITSLTDKQINTVKEFF